MKKEGKRDSSSSSFSAVAIYISILFTCSSFRNSMMQTNYLLDKCECKYITQSKQYNTFSFHSEFYINEITLLNQCVRERLVTVFKIVVLHWPYKWCSGFTRKQSKRHNTRSKINYAKDPLKLTGFRLTQRMFLTCFRLLDGVSPFLWKRYQYLVLLLKTNI